MRPYATSVWGLKLPVYEAFKLLVHEALSYECMNRIALARSVEILQPTSAYVSIRQHTSAYVMLLLRL
jgi:hypothetical protein